MTRDPDWRAHGAALVTRWRATATELEGAAVRAADRGAHPARTDALATRAKTLRDCAEELANAGTTQH